MADDGGGGYGRYFAARDSDGSDVGGGGTGGSPRPSPSQRRGASTSAQERLKARIVASRNARRRRSFLVTGGIVSALVLFVAGAGWAFTGYVNHIVNRVDAGTSAGSPGWTAAPGSPGTSS
jgi:hypothetical protein